MHARHRMSPRRQPVRFAQFKTPVGGQAGNRPLPCRCPHRPSHRSAPARPQVRPHARPFSTHPCPRAVVSSGLITADRGVRTPAMVSWLALDVRVAARCVVRGGRRGEGLAALSSAMTRNLAALELPMRLCCTGVAVRRVCTHVVHGWAAMAQTTPLPAPLCSAQPAVPAAAGSRQEH